MPPLDDLQAARANLIARYRQVTENPQPTYDVDGQRVEHTAYRRGLLDEIARLHKLLAAEGDAALAPFEDITLGST